MMVVLSNDGGVMGGCGVGSFWVAVVVRFRW